MTPLPDISTHLREKKGFCHPNWEAIGKQIEKSVPSLNWNSAWEQAARQWTERLCDKLGGAYHLYETANFMIISEAPDRVMLDAGRFCEKALVRILSALSGVALDEGYGKHVVLMFSHPDDYYQYTSYFYADGEHPMSGGVYLSGEGYAHFAFPATDYSSYRAVLVHELTHACLSHLPLPTWVNEAMAMRMEDAVSESQSLSIDREKYDRHAKHWNSRTIQQFWEGESWEIPCDSFELSYNLAQVIWRKIEVDLGAPRQAVLEFVSSADEKDAGEAACKAAFDVSLGELVGDFLGDGDWGPKPDLWLKKPRRNNGDKPTKA